MALAGRVFHKVDDARTAFQHLAIPALYFRFAGERRNELATRCRMPGCTVPGRLAMQVDAAGFEELRHEPVPAGLHRNVDRLQPAAAVFARVNSPDPERFGHRL